MQEVTVGIVGLGNVGGGTITILQQNAQQIAAKLGFGLRIGAICSRSVKSRPVPAGLEGALVTDNWRDVVADPKIDIVAELIGGTGVAREVVESAIDIGKCVVTANKELIALEGIDLWQRAANRGVGLALEASVCGGIPIHTALREGICGDRVESVLGILNGTCNFILSEIEKHGTDFDAVLVEAQRLGYAEADPADDVDGFDARSKLALLTAIAFGVRLEPSRIAMEGIRRVSPIDFLYARQLGCTIRLLASAQRTEDGLFASVRPSLIPLGAALASVSGAYNAVYSKGAFGEDTFYSGRGAGALPTGVAVVSDLMKLARDLRFNALQRVSPFGFSTVAQAAPLDIGAQKREWYLRFRVADRLGIIAALSKVLAEHHIGIEAVLQLPDEDWRSLPFVITVEATAEANLRAALARMAEFDFMAEPPLAMPIEKGL